MSTSLLAAHPTEWTADQIADYTLAYVSRYPAERIAAAFSHGAAWYPSVHETAHDMSTGARALTLYQACGVLAAFSIRQQWAYTERIALAYADGAPARGVPLARSKADAIAALKRPECERLPAVLDVLAGHKVRAFCDCIARPGTSRAVPLDVHMCNVYGVESGILARVNRAGGTRRLVYQVIADGVRIAADYCGVPVPAYQAGIWTLERGAPDGVYRPSLVRDGAADALAAD